MSGYPASDLVALDEGLAALGAVDPRQAQVVELRFLGGLIAFLGLLDPVIRALANAHSDHARTFSSPLIHIKERIQIEDRQSELLNPGRIIRPFCEVFQSQRLLCRRGRTAGRQTPRVVHAFGRGGALFQ